MQHEILEAPIAVYNFEAEEFHTYYVGSDGVLVHNTCSEKITQTYNELRKVFAGSGLEVHHIVEKRFAPVVGYANKTGSMLSVALTKSQHREFTNAWRGAIGYGASKTATIDEIWEAAKTVYRNHPALLEAAKITIFGG